MISYANFQVRIQLALGLFLTALSLCDAATLPLGPSALFQTVKTGPLTYVSKCVEKWSHQEVMVLEL